MDTISSDYIVNTSSLEETETLGVMLAAFLKPGMVIILNGTLGAGKTTFAGGIAKGLGIKERIISPTFNILKCYFNAEISFFHIDAYRLENGVNKELGLEEFIESEGITIIEWGQFVSELIPEQNLSVNINFLQENHRQFVFRALGDKYRAVIKSLEGGRI